MVHSLQIHFGCFLHGQTDVMTYVTTSLGPVETAKRFLDRLTETFFAPRDWTRTWRNLYGVTTGAHNQAVKRNTGRFPTDRYLEEIDPYEVPEIIKPHPEGPVRRILRRILPPLLSVRGCLAQTARFR